MANQNRLGSKGTAEKDISNKPIVMYRPRGRLWLEIRFGERPYLIVGRVPGADIVVQDPSVSRWHCGIGFEDGRFLLKDLGSSNGTFHNDVCVEECALASGDRIQIGLRVLLFQFQADTHTAELLELNAEEHPG